MKYFKPRSVTWWASMLPIAAGVFIASEPLHGLTDWAMVVSSLFDDVSPAVLINMGLAGVGIRGALG